VCDTKAFVEREKREVLVRLEGQRVSCFRPPLPSHKKYLTFSILSRVKTQENRSEKAQKLPGSVLQSRYPVRRINGSRTMTMRQMGQMRPSHRATARFL
jgi:hypothetical protein